MALGEVIAERVLEHARDGSARVVVRIGRPTPDPAEGGDWRCPFQVVGLGDEAVHEAFGVDAVQALQLCFLMIGAHLDGQPVTWLGDGDTGFYPVDFRRALEQSRESNGTACHADAPPTARSSGE